MHAPSYDIDIYADDVIRNPWPHYAAMRDLGPVVWLPRHGNFALTRYREVQAALRDHRRFCSSKGVAGDEFGCTFLQGNTVASDEPRHGALRQAMAPPLLPGALAGIEGRIQEVADDLITDLVARGSFDAVTDLARHLPLTIVRDLVGLPDFGQERMLSWAAAAFDVLGMQNDRGKAALTAIQDMRSFIKDRAGPDRLKPGSWTARIVELANEGALDPDLAPFAIRDYINPSLDTTISATGQLIYQLGRSPDQWERLKQTPELALNAVNEAVRLGTPIRSFSRHTTEEIAIDGVAIPADARVMMLFAAANRDERAFPDPDGFDISRSPKRHLGFGSGIHMCVGMHLAQMEMVALLRAMIPRIGRIEVGEPRIAMNNTIAAFASLPVTVEAESRRFAMASPRARPPLPDLLAGRIRKREIIAPDIVSFEIEPADGVVFPLAEPGAHIDIHIRPGLVRQYSLTGRLGEGRYRIAVQKEPRSKGGSEAMHARYPEGAEILISLPRNHFPLDDTAEHVLLLAGGIGLTPLLAMAWHLHEKERPFTLHVVSRSEERLPFADQLSSSPFAASIHVHLDDGPQDQQLNLERIIRKTPSGTHLYLCGPKGFMAMVKDRALKFGLPEAGIHLEHFGAEIDADGESFTVITARSGQAFLIERKQSILDALEQAGITVETSCRNGVCGSCLTPVLDGTPDHRDRVQTDVEKATNQKIAVCCSRSKTKTLVLDV